jgi:Fur family peroxide stress response transcriptional regulator
MDVNARTDQMMARLREEGYKITPQRIAIVKVLAESRGHPSVERIYDAVKGVFPTISMATIYRNVMIIKALGEVIELGFADGSNRYDGNKPYPHPHLICINCKRVTDPEVGSLEDMMQTLSAETGFQIISHRLDFFGICRSCQRTKANFQ